MILSNVEGVSDKKVERLNEEDIYLAEDLAMASAAKIQDIKGVSMQAVANAIDHIDYTHRFVDAEQLNYECGYCGKNYQLRARKPLKRHQNQCEANPANEGDI